MSKYTTPKLNRGKEPKFIPKGSSKQKELAKNIWYVSYTYEGKQKKVKADINRFKDPIEKEREGEILLLSIKNDLANGYNPNKPLEWIESLRKEQTTLADAVNHFEAYHKKHNSRKKSISTYMSKLNSLKAFMPNILLSEITTKQIQKFIGDKIDDKTYSQGSVKSAKRIFSTFFNVCIQEGLISNNPMAGFDKKINSKKKTEEKHIPYTEEDLKKIFDHLDKKDKYTAFFCRMVYYTCMRPKEIRGLKIENIDLEKKTITIPSEIKKVTTNHEDDILEIDETFVQILKDLNLEQYPKHYYLTGSTKNIIGANEIGENTPYNKLKSALKKLDLDNRGYDLYSFKHTSNIKKYTAGWTVSEIMKANRHMNVSTTEIYLKKLGSFVDIKNKKIPVI